MYSYFLFISIWQWGCHVVKVLAYHTKGPGSVPHMCKYLKPISSVPCSDITGILLKVT